MKWLKAHLRQVDGWQTNEMLRLALTLNYCMPGNKLGLLEQPLMTVWASDISAKFRLAVLRDSSRDLTFSGSLSS